MPGVVRPGRLLFSNFIASVEHDLLQRFDALTPFRLRRAVSQVCVAFLLSLGALCWRPAIAADDSDQNLFSAADARLHREATSEQTPELNRWTGNLPVRGILSVNIDRGAHDGPKNINDLILVTFTPDKDSVALLPQAKGSYQAPIEGLVVSGDPKDLLQSLIGAKEAELVMHGSAIRYQWPVTLSMTEFTASIECDHRSYAMQHTTPQIDRDHLDVAFHSID